MAENKCTLSNEDLLQQCEQWVHKLAKSGGKDWCLQVPVNFNKDPDMLFMELINRFKANIQQGNAWVKASEHWPEDHNKVHWRRVEDKSPLLIVGRNYQENIIAQFGRVYTPDALEWLDESAPTIASNEIIAALQKFVSRHEAGLLPDRFVYEQAKKVLEG